MEQQWIRITSVADIPRREGRGIRIGKMDVAIFNLGDRFVAFENRCPHRGGPLADGIVSSMGDAVTVTCPLHNWRICVDSGGVQRPVGQDRPPGDNGCVRRFDVKVENGIVMLAPAIEQGESAAA